MRRRIHIAFLRIVFLTDLVALKTTTMVTAPRTRSEPAETEILFKAGEVNGGCTIRYTVV